MSDIVVGVRLNADGSALVGQLKLSSAEADQLSRSVKGASEASRDLSQASGQAVAAQARAVQGMRQTSAAAVEQTKNVGLARAGWQSFGFQIQDVFASAASGSRLSVIFAQQSGQMASAIAQIAQASQGSTGKLAGLASFLGGPWGIAISIAVSAGSALISMLVQADEAATKVQFSTSSLADSQSLLGSVMDLTTGKMKAQTEAAKGLAVAQAILNRVNAQKDAAKFRTEVADLQKDDYQLRGGMGGGLWVKNLTPGAQKSISQEVLARMADPEGKAGISTADAVQRLDNLRKAGRITDEAFAAAAASVANLGVEVENVKIADATLRMVNGEGTASDRGLLLKPEKTKNPKKDNSAEKAAREAERLATFSDQAAEAVARLRGEYDIAPRDIDRAGEATRSLDRLIGDVNKRLETGKGLTADQRDKFIEIRTEAQRLKPVIQESLIRPILDMLDGQQRQIELGRLTLAGRQADADALQLTYSLMDKMGVESEDQLAVALAQRGVTEAQVRALYGSLSAMREQTREMRIQQALQGSYLSALGDMRENVRLTLEDLRKDGPKAVGDFFQRSLDVVDRLFSEVATEKLFGGFFRDLEDQLTGSDKVSDAGEKMAKAVGDASVQIVDLGKAAATAATLMNGKASGPNPDGSGVGNLVADAAGEANIVVTANPWKQLKGGFREGFEGFFKDLKGDFRSIFTDIFGDRGIFSESLGKTLGGLAAGASTGATGGSLVTGILGIKGSSTGGAIGGALGSAIAGPLGSIVGGALGSIAGGMLKKSKYGTTTITGGADEDVSTAGNNKARKEASTGLASSVQETLASIAEEFGGSVGSFRTSIGMYKDSYRVSTTGRSGKLKGKYSDVADFGDDEAGALAYAVMDAITDGGIVGISAAVKKALQSSADLDDALDEALKVKEVEKLLGDLGAELEDQFKIFENQAKERVRIASEYGFDVVAIEKRNAEDRAKLIEEILTERVGSLQQLLNDMKYGDLFEGSAADRREALLVEIAKTRAAAEAGEDGAADRLADQLRQLTELSRESYGTAGDEYVGDRDNAAASAEAVIKAENDRIKAAQDAVAATNTRLDTANELANEQVRYLAEIASGLARAGYVVTTSTEALNTALVQR